MKTTIRILIILSLICITNNIIAIRESKKARDLSDIRYFEELARLKRIPMKMINTNSQYEYMPAEVEKMLSYYERQNKMIKAYLRITQKYNRRWANAK